MSTIKIVFPTPTDNITSSSNLDFLIYNGTLGSEVLFATINRAAVNKTILSGNVEITGINVTDGQTYNFSAKARDEALNLSAFSPITVHTVPVPSYVFATSANTTMSSFITFTAGSPNKFESSSTNQFIKYNTTRPAGFAIKVFISDIFSKGFGIGIDDVNNNTDTLASWSASISVNESFALRLDGPNGASLPNNPTTVVVGVNNYIRMTRADASSAIYVYYYNGTSESLVHTYTAAPTAIYVKGFTQSSSRRISDLQIS